MRVRKENSNFCVHGLTVGECRAGGHAKLEQITLSDDERERERDGERGGHAQLFAMHVFASFPHFAPLRSIRWVLVRFPPMKKPSNALNCPQLQLRTAAGEKAFKMEMAGRPLDTSLPECVKMCSQPQSFIAARREWGNSERVGYTSSRNPVGT